MIIYILSTLLIFLPPLLQIFYKYVIFSDFSYLLIYLFIFSIIAPAIASVIINQISELEKNLNNKYLIIFIIINAICSILLLMYVLGAIFNNFPSY